MYMFLLKNFVEFDRIYIGENMDNQFKIIIMNNFKDRGKIIGEYIKENFETDDPNIIYAKNVRFSNGEGKVILGESVRNKIVFIISDVSNYSETYEMYGHTNHMSPDEHFVDIKRTISAIAGKAKKIIVVMPLLYESRQHRRLMRESLDCAMALQELERLGVDSVLTFDAHDINIQNAVSKMSFDSFFPNYQVMKTLLKKEDFRIDKDNMVVISPDTGAMQRAIKYANMLGLDVGMFYKRRDYTKIVNGKNPVVQHEYLGRDVKNKYILIVDDMIASGGSVIDVATEMKKRGALGAYIVATFSFFTDGIEKFEQAYKAGIIKKVYTTNLSYMPVEYKGKPWIGVVDCLEFVARIITNIIEGQSISYLVDSDEKIKELLIEHNLKFSFKRK